MMFHVGQLWLRQLWQENEGKKPWGSAIFENPQWQAEHRDCLNSYNLKSSGAINIAFCSICCATLIKARYRHECLDWPSDTPTGDKNFPQIVNGFRFDYL